MELTSPSATAGTRSTTQRRSGLRATLGPDWKEAYLFLLPALILLVTVIAFPFLRAVYLSFTRTTSLQIGNIERSSVQQRHLKRKRQAQPGTLLARIRPCQRKCFRRSPAANGSYCS